jgi:hypothetical protein
MVAVLLMVGGALGVLSYHSYLKTPSTRDVEYETTGGYIPMSSTEDAPYEPPHSGAAGSQPV